MIFGFGLRGDDVIELFEQNIRTNDRQSSKGNQLKWENDGIWYKADYTGYEGLAEYVISHLLAKSSLLSEEYVLYESEQIKYKSTVYTGTKSKDFLKSGWQIVTLERLFKNFFNDSLYQSIYRIADHKSRLVFLVDQVERITGLKEFGKYINKLFTIDAVFLNEDRHTHNIAVLMDENGTFTYCPIFDHGAGLLSDITMDYPLDGDVYEWIDSATSKTICSDFDEQLDISEELYGSNMKFSFSQEDIAELLKEINTYSSDIIIRVEKILYAQMRKYRYLFTE